MNVLKLVRVLFASPGDTEVERAVAGKVSEEINQIWGQRTGIWLKALMWETDTYSATYQDGQAVINQQLGDDYEAFVGIMRERFGSPTARHESGTQEEYLRAYSRYEEDPESVDIGFYFSSAPISREHLSPKSLQQMQKLLAFRQEVRSGGTLDRDYSGIDEFEALIRLHLSRLMQKWEARLGSPSKILPEVGSSDAPTVDPVATNLPPLSQETLIQDLLAASDYLKRAIDIQLQLTQAVSRFGQQTQVRAQSLQDAVATEDAAVTMRVLEEVHGAQAQELVEIGDVIGPLVIPFAQYCRGALLPGSRVAACTAATKTNLEGARGLAGALEVVYPQFDEMRNALEGWRNSLLRTQATTLEVLRNRYHVVYAADALLAEIKGIVSLMRDVASALRDAAG